MSSGLRAPLSPRERQVVELLLEGLTANAIAGKLGLSYHTVVTYISNAAHKVPGSGPPQARLIAWGEENRDSIG